MAGDRTDKIHDRVRLVLGIDAIDKIPSNLLYGKIDDLQRRIAEDALCIEGSASLVVSGGTVSEPSGFFRFKQIVLGTGSKIQPTELDVNEYDALTRISPSTTGAEEFFKRWGGTLTFYSLDNGTYTAFLYKVPSTNVSTTVDPETPQTFDLAIEYGTVAELAPLVGGMEIAGNYYALYEKEFRRALNAWRRTKDKGFSIYYHDF